METKDKSMKNRIALCLFVMFSMVPLASAHADDPVPIPNNSDLYPDESELPHSVELAYREDFLDDIRIDVSNVSVEVLTSKIEYALGDEFDALFDQASYLYDEFAAKMMESPDAYVNTLEVWGYDREKFELEATALFEDLLQTYPDIFAGGVMAPANNHVFVGYKTSPDQIRQYLDSANVDFTYEIREAPVTFVEREKIYAKLTHTELGLVSKGQFTDTVTFQLKPGFDATYSDQLIEVLDDFFALPKTQTDDLQSNIASLQTNQDTVTGIQVGPIVLTLETEDTTIIDEAISGGVALFTSVGARRCTSGISMQTISSGIRYSSTAAHCVGNGGYLYRNNQAMGTQTYRHHDASGRDFTMLTATGVLSPALGNVYHPSGAIAIKGPWRSTQWPGQNRCKMGATTGYTCGVIQPNACNYVAATYSSAPGDSGGAIIYPYSTVLAAGNHRGRCGSVAIHTGIYNMELGSNNSAPTTFRVITS